MIVKIDKVFEKDTDKIKDKKILLKIAYVIEKVREADDIVSIKPDLFAHKLCALLDRNILTNRDIFDIYYFMKQKTPINKVIVEKRMGKELTEYLDLCIARIEKINAKTLLNGLGELVDINLKEFVKTKLKAEAIQLLKMYREFPILS